MKYFSFILSLISLPLLAAQYELRGNIEYKLINYTDNVGQNLGQYSSFNFEQKSKFNNHWMALNQFRARSMSLENDVDTKITPTKKNSFESIIGENYLRFQSDKVIIQAGFQEVVWGEAFGFNYADFINPKDDRITFYSLQSDARLPLLLLNTKFFFPIGSLQILYGPRPEFSKTLPIDLFIGSSLIQDKVIINKEKSPSLFKESEYGFKLSTSFIGFDISAFYFNLLDTNPFYTASNVSLSTITLNENHGRVSKEGISFVKTIYEFVLRSDFILSNNVNFNYFSGLNLLNYQSKTTEIVLSLDTPTYNKYTGYLIAAHKTQDLYYTGSFQNQTEDNIIAKISKSLDNEKSLELSYSHDIKNSGKAIQALINWPVNNDTEIKIGTEYYFGDEKSTFAKMKRINNIFFSLKNFFKL
jgi:hypothetical protein